MSPMASAEGPKWVTISAFALAAATAAISVAAAALISASIRGRESRRRLASRVRDLEASFKASQEKCAAERRGRIRAQQELRKSFAEKNLDESKQDSAPSYPMAPIGTVRSCFSTRNGAPRQPLLVPLARACLIIDPSRVPLEALEGLGDYSHCWILYVFHLNTDLEKLWKKPSRSKFKAKVRVPRLEGGKMGVLATRSPHRPCPIGLTVAKVEALDGHAVLLSGIDLVDGTPVLDIKPYLPYSDSIQGASVPMWLEEDNTLAVASVSFSKEFPSSLSSCWVTAEKQSLYASAGEFQSLIKEVLSWDIRSLSQRSRPHNAVLENERNAVADPLELHDAVGVDSYQVPGTNSSASPSTDVTYHLTLEAVDVQYRIDGTSNIIVERATLLTDVKGVNGTGSNYLRWKEKFGQ